MNSLSTSQKQPDARLGSGCLITGIVIASLTEALASTLLSLGRNDIIGDIYATPDEFAWLDVSYTTMKLIGFAATPWLITRIDPRRILLVAIAVMGLAAAITTLVPRLEPLVILRTVQGLAGGTLLVSGQAILFWRFAPSRQPVVQAMFAMGAVVAPATLAPLLQGWLILIMKVLLVVAIGLIALTFRQHRAPAPLLDLALFRTTDFAFAFVVSFVAGAALFGSAFLIPAFALSVLGVTPTEAGALLLPSGVIFAVTLLGAALLMQRRCIPPIATVPFGILSVMIAMWMLSGSTLESGADDMMPAILIRGFGLGCLFLSITLIAFSRLAPAHLAYGIGLFNIGRQLGGLIGVAGLQTLIEHQQVANSAILDAALSPGSRGLAARVAENASLLASRGMDPVFAESSARALLARSVGGQGIVIAFNTAFNAVALLFVAAVPIIVALKIILARGMEKKTIAGAAQ